MINLAAQNLYIRLIMSLGLNIRFSSWKYLYFANYFHWI